MSPTVSDARDLDLLTRASYWLLTIDDIDDDDDDQDDTEDVDNDDDDGWVW